MEAFAASKTIVPNPPVTDLLSNILISLPSSSRAPVSAAWIVAERSLDIFMQITLSAPCSKHSSKTVLNAPGEGAAVCGTSSLLCILL